jgi:HD-GYP domain-containing protein (c-di-GMP phosphodiesterase class II)
VLTLPIEEARRGMKLAVTVPHPTSPENDLLTAGYVLDDLVLKRMRELGVSFIYVDYPSLVDLDDALLPYLTPTRKAIYGQMKRSIQAVQKHSRPQVSYMDYYALTRQFVLSVLRDGKQPYYLDEMSLRMGECAVVHATTVAHLCLALGIALESYITSQRRRIRHDRDKELLNLGVAGMLHDLGKAALPPHLRACHALKPPEKDGDRAVWEAHAQAGYEMIRAGVEPTAAAAVRHHHQHYDGTGFPRHEVDGTSKNYFEGEHIHVFGRILLAADLYDRLSFDEDQRRRRWSFEVLHLLRERCAAWLDPEILAALPRVIPPFPPGMKVELSDGAPCAVVGLSLKDPYRPIVKRFAPNGWTLMAESVDLSTERHLSIARAGGAEVEPFLPSREPPEVVKERIREHAATTTTPLAAPA